MATRGRQHPKISPKTVRPILTKRAARVVPGGGAEYPLGLLPHSGARVTRITDFWPDPYELPASRAHLVERY